MNCWKAAIAAAATVFALGAYSQSFPNKPIKIVVPYSAGGTTDMLARAVGQKMSEKWGQSVLVENKPGANGIIGIDLVAKARPDGYTLGIASPGTHASNQSLYETLPHDPIKDFTPVSLLVRAPMVMVVNANVPIKSVSDLLAAAKKDPGKLTVASGGTGSSQHLAAELFEYMAGVDLTHVPYKGGGAAYTDLLGGRVEVMIDALQQSMPHIKSGRLRPIAVASAQKLPQLPEVPTIAESGVPGYESGAWYGLVAPAGLPKDVLSQIATEVDRILKLPDIKARFEDPGLVVVGGEPEVFAEHIRIETEKLGKVIKAANIKAE